LYSRIAGSRMCPRNNNNTTAPSWRGVNTYNHNDILEQTY
jgi:hypothetical protein